MMFVLVACEESQAVCKAFRAKGHTAFSCDIQDCSGGHPEWHIKEDVTNILNGNCEFKTVNGDLYKLIGKWDLIIAHPPCTYLSNAGACRMFHKKGSKTYIDKERYIKMKEGKEFFLKCLNADCSKICVENPLPMKICNLPKQSQIIQPYYFGNPYSKRTLLWLKGLPPLFSTGICAKHETWLPSNTAAYKLGKGGSNGTVRGQKNYSKTFPGIAQAMAEQWG